MKRCKITAIRKTEYKDLMEKYENPMENACDIEEGQVFIAEGWKRPEGFCESAWESISPFVMTLVYGGSDIYEGWMKNKTPRPRMTPMMTSMTPQRKYGALIQNNLVCPAAITAGSEE